MSPIIPLFILLAMVPRAAAQEPQEPLVKKVKSSISKGVVFLCDQQRDGGGWDVPKDDATSKHLGGPTALAVASRRTGVFLSLSLMPDPTDHRPPAGRVPSPLPENVALPPAFSTVTGRSARRRRLSACRPRHRSRAVSDS